MRAWAGRRRRLGVAIVVAAVLAGGAAAQPGPGRGGSDAAPSFDLVRKYLAELRNPAGKPPIAGPRQFRLERQTGGTVTDEVAPIERLAAMLRGCRKASFSASWGDPAAPKRVEGRQHWECLGEGAEDKSVRVTAISRDGRSIEGVTALLGGPLYFPGPAPGVAPRPTEAETAEFTRMNEQVTAFLGKVAAGEGVSTPAEVLLWTGGEKVPISLARVRELLASCERLSASRDSVPIGGEQRMAVTLLWKCDKRSMAYADLQGLATVRNGLVDRFYVQPYLDYAIPPSFSRAGE